MTVTRKARPVALDMSITADPARNSSHEWSRHMLAVAQSHDRESFMQIYDHYAPRLQRYLLGLGTSPGLAEELVQEAMLRVWRKAAQFDPSRASVSTWVYRITRNLYIDVVRREPRWQPLSDSLEELESGAPEPGRSDTEASAEHAQIQQAIQSLSALQARLIRMSYLESRSHREISEQLDMPLGTVKSGVRRALQKLRVRLGKTS